MSKKQQVELEAVFRLKPVRTETETGECEIKFVDYVSPTDKFGDEPIEINASDKDTLFIKNIDGYDITVNAYRNNIIGNFLVKNRNLPVCSLQFMYSKNIVVGYLFNVFIYFLLDPEKNHFLKSPKDYVGAHVYGRYFMVIDCDDELLTGMNNLTDSEIQKYSIEDVALKMGDQSFPESELIRMIEEDTKEKKEFYQMLLKGKDVHFTRNLKTMAEEYLFPIFNSPHISGLLKYALKIRSKKRAKEYGAYEGKYKVPTKVLKLQDIKDNPDVVDKFINDQD